MRQSFALKPVTNSTVDHEINGALLEHPGANALDDVISGTIFHNNGVDPRHVQQVAQHQSCGARPDNSHLSASCFHP